MIVKSRSILKIILSVLLLAAALLAAVSLFWYGFKYLPYMKMAENMQLNNDSEKPRYVYTDDQYLYRLKMPGFLSFESGFLYVGPADETAASFTVDENGDLKEQNSPHVDMFIWPRIFSEPEYGVTIYEEDWSRQFMMSSQGEYLSDEDMFQEELEEVRALFEKHRDQIRDVMQAADALWGSVLKR